MNIPEDSIKELSVRHPTFSEIDLVYSTKKLSFEETVLLFSCSKAVSAVMNALYPSLGDLSRLDLKVLFLLTGCDPEGDLSDKIDVVMLSEAVTGDGRTSRAVVLRLADGRKAIVHLDLSDTYAPKSDPIDITKLGGSVWSLYPGTIYKCLHGNGDNCAECRSKPGSKALFFGRGIYEALLEMQGR